MGQVLPPYTIDHRPVGDHAHHGNKSVPYLLDELELRCKQVPGRIDRRITHRGQHGHYRSGTPPLGVSLQIKSGDLPHEFHMVVYTMLSVLFSINFNLPSEETEDNINPNPICPECSGFKLATNKDLKRPLLSTKRPNSSKPTRKRARRAQGAGDAPPAKRTKLSFRLAGSPPFDFCGTVLGLTQDATASRKFRLELAVHNVFRIAGHIQAPHPEPFNGYYQFKADEERCVRLTPRAGPPGAWTGLASTWILLVSRLLQIASQTLCFSSLTPFNLPINSSQWCSNHWLSTHRAKPEDTVA
ncbi:hypothetical protein DER44DRAFT_869018 [Fusarium oxysporum]|nr:hypothetical protein DER44DRAFT_869018 [Fusarium oxysporum]